MKKETIERRQEKLKFVQKHIDLFMQIPMFNIKDRAKHEISLQLINIAIKEIGYSKTMGKKDIFQQLEKSYKKHLIQTIQNI